MKTWFFGQSSTVAAPEWVTQLGAFGVALGVAWWLLGRSDRQVKAERDEAAIEIARLAGMLAAEQAAHNETRKQLYDELRRNPPPPSSGN